MIKSTSRFFFRFASFTSLVNYFSGLGIEDSCQILSALLSEAKNSKVDLVALSKQMIEDLFENVDNILTVRASLSCLVRELLNVSHQPQTVLGVHIDDPLLYLQKEISMKLVMSIVNPILIRFFYLKIHSIRKK